jgi:16S rRNA G966 N2-methylase RsmD
VRFAFGLQTREKAYICHMLKLNIKYRNPNELKDYEGNAKIHNEVQLGQLDRSISEFGFYNPIIIDENDVIIAGHGRRAGAIKNGLETVPTVCLTHLTDRQKRALRLADNKIADNATYDIDKITREIEALVEAEYDTELTGFNEQEIDAILREDLDILPDDSSLQKTGLMPEGYRARENDGSGALYRKFGYPPFSVLNSGSGFWQERKREWTGKIGDMGESREGKLGEHSLMSVIGNGVSILDPVLCELMCKWFAKPGFRAFDPFAGDTAFGFVSATLGLEFVGIELRDEQARLNQERCDQAGLNARYITDDSRNLAKYIKPSSVDMVFSCPPYADLEVYSDDPRDLSNQTHDDFFSMYAEILTATYATLKPNRFAVIVIGEVRNSKGEYISLVPRTIEIMQAAGYTYYNEIILVSVGGTLPIRVGRQFNAGRKIGKQHQNILVFYKGRINAIKEEFGEVIAEDDMEQEN